MFSMYNRHTRTSTEQLHEDFGAFPPVPLRCEPPGSGFVVVRVRGPGAWINYWRRSEELIRAFELDPATVAPELRHVISNLAKSN
jgi:hypothetical protein